jgi:hypothetical protein
MKGVMSDCWQHNGWHSSLQLYWSRVRASGLLVGKMKPTKAAKLPQSNQQHRQKQNPPTNRPEFNLYQKEPDLDCASALRAALEN